MPEDPDAIDTFGDDIAEVLLADAVAELYAGPDTGGDSGDPTTTPAMGTTQPPDTGDPLTQPTNQPAPVPAAPMPTPPGAPAPGVPQPAMGQPVVPQPMPQQPMPSQQPGVPAGPVPNPTQVFGQQNPAAPNVPAAPATGEPGWPENTPVEQMTAEQQVAYWRSYARKHEQRARERADYDEIKAKANQFDQMVAASQTDQQRAVAEASARARNEALAEAGSQIVDAWVWAAAAGRLDPQRVSTLLEGLDRRRFINATTGQVDTDRVTSYVHSLAPAPAYPVAAMPGQPATGQPGYPQPAPTTPIPAGVPTTAAPAQPPATGPAVYPPPAMGQPLYAPPSYPFAPPPGYPPPAAPGVPPAAPAAGAPVPGYPAGYPAGLPAGQVPDFGQGQRANTGPTGLAAGKAIAAARFAKPQPGQGGAPAQQ
jgi:hypothetical protein